MLLQPLQCCCVDCAIHHERDVREEQKYIYVARTSNNRVILSGELYCCLLPQCEALRTCRSGFPIPTMLAYKNPVPRKTPVQTNLYVLESHRVLIIIVWLFLLLDLLEHL